MKKEELEQLFDLRKEIKELDARVARMQAERVGKVQDKVHTSMHEFPYTYTSKTITGVDNTNTRKRRALTDNEILLLRRRRKLVETEHRITKWINDIEDSRIRRAASLRYEDGLSWNQVAKRMNCDRTYPEKLIKKYLKENEEKNKLSHNSRF